MLERIRIVMVNTSHAGNIGAAARAMKTMGLGQLWLVDPVEPPDGKASAMASGATDILAQARVVPDLDAALAGCGMVLGASARRRSVPWPHMPVRKATAAALAQAATTEVAILFGRENSGLTNEELARCHLHLEIPGNPDYPVLNVAAAIQVVCHELRQHWLAGQAEADDAPARMDIEPVRWDKPPATAEQFEQFFAHLERTLLDLDFYVADDPRQLLIRLRRLFMRARPDEVEIRILRGILSAAGKAAQQAKAAGAREE